MSKLTTSERNKLPSSAFVFPKTRSYPVHDESHARAALSDVSKFGNSAEKSAVRAAVARKYPGMEDEGAAVSHHTAPKRSSDANAMPSKGLLET